jgi:hypothetical protein
VRGCRTLIQLNLPTPAVPNLQANVTGLGGALAGGDIDLAYFFIILKTKT